MSEYYLDSREGCDNADGQSPQTAWRSLTRAGKHLFAPGDRLLLRRGCVWTGETLSPQGSGESEAPISIDAYGEGARPLIDRRGRADDVENGTAAMTLYNQSYWEIRRIALSNRNPDGSGRAEDPVVLEDGSCRFPRRSGLSIDAHWTEGTACITIRGIVVEDVEVWDIEGSNGDEGNCYRWDITDNRYRGSSGGCAIGISCIDSPDGRWRARTEDVRIENCRVHNCSGTCLFLGSSAWTYYDSHRRAVLRGNRITCDEGMEHSPAGAYIVSAEEPLVEENDFHTLSNGVAFQVCRGGVCRRNIADTMHGRMVLCSRLTGRSMYWDGTGYDVDSACRGVFHLTDNVAARCAAGSFSMFDLSEGGKADIRVENNLSFDSEHFFYHQLFYHGYRMTFRGNTVVRGPARRRERPEKAEDARLFTTLHETPVQGTYRFEENVFLYREQQVEWDTSGAVQYVDNHYEGLGETLPAGVTRRKEAPLYAEDQPDEF